ncbi:MAG: hypothetical protein NTY19_22625 [Planctomycetota bacterium]|nr:hypothetical protein [Planctomycetota bacterium]
MLILFLHGWQSTPGGVKPTYLRSHRPTVINPAMPDDDFPAAVAIAQAEFDQQRPDVVVAVPVVVPWWEHRRQDHAAGVALPAWKRWGTATTVKPRHGDPAQPGGRRGAVCGFRRTGREQWAG